MTTGVLERLADGDVFGSLGLSRRDALWAVKGLGRTGDDDNLPLFSMSAPANRREPDAHLPPMPLGEEVINDYRFLRLSLKAHPVEFLRSALRSRGVISSEALGTTAPGLRVAVAGLVLVRQRPGTAKGVIFMTLEDEGGVANTIVWPKVFERFRPIVLGARLVIVRGKLQSENGVIHVIADSVEDATDLLSGIADGGQHLSSLARGDEVKRPQAAVNADIQANVRKIPGARVGADGVAMTEPKCPKQPQAPQMPRNRSRTVATKDIVALPLFPAAELDTPARATRHAMPKGRNFR